MRRYDLYIETSAWNFVLAEDAPERRDLTLEFFRRARAGSFRTFVSQLVLAELADTPDAARRGALVELVRGHRPIELTVTPEALALSERYLIQGTVPRKYSDDALHVATAVVHRLDAVVSWNLTHLLKLKTRREVNALNRLNGYPEIDIVTPEEVL